MNNIFKVNQTISYNLRKKCTSKWKYQFYEILYRDHILLTPKIWSLVPETIKKNCDTLISCAEL